MNASSPLLHCTNHPNYPLDRVNPDPNAQKHLFCTECLLQHEDGISLYKKFPLFKDFIANAANIFQEGKAQAKPHDQLPSKYNDVIIGKAEHLNKVSSTVEQQKAQLITLFDQFKASLMKVINQYQEKYLKILDDQVNEIYKSFETFEQQVKRAYPSTEEINNLYPTLDQLNNTLEEIKEVPDLEEYIKNLKQNLAGGNNDKSANEIIFDLKSEQLVKAETQFPPLLTKLQDSKIMEAELASAIEKIIWDSQLQKNIDNHVSALNIFETNKSLILASNDMAIIKSWIPPKYVFAPKLLYRASQDGFTGKDFHTHCDGKGPTITLVKCEFQGSNEPTVIGGFLDKSWNSKDQQIESKDSFIFSVSAKKKCELKQKGIAAYGYPMSGPCFGDGVNMDIYISKKFSESYMNPGTYKNSECLNNMPNYKGGFARFDPLEIEVYTLK